MKEFVGNGDELQFRINSLSDPVRRYMALDFVLGREYITDQEKTEVQSLQNEMFKKMKFKEKVELTNHRIWLLKRQEKK